MQYLTHPDTLSKTKLLEILKTRCIEIADVKSLEKADLVEVYKKTALPLPQRRYNEAKPIGKRLSQLRLTREITTAVEEDDELYKTKTSSQKSEDTTNIIVSKCGKLKLSSSIGNVKENEKTESKCNKIKSSSGVWNVTEKESENCPKRKINDTEVPTQTEVKKRQKITWP